ncbi:hypothetical protein [Streptomyces sp. NPDC088350]|uniref:hypothetical protein n=1 Tax=Streptomyces sp. NPDC088350 TaxID=3365854 RepID=UPI003819CD06
MSARAAPGAPPRAAPLLQRHPLGGLRRRSVHVQDGDRQHRLHHDSFGGHPATNLVKSCYVADAGGPPGYTACAAGDGTCAVPGYQRDGANGDFVHQVTDGTVDCSNAHFGDPVDGIAKSRYLPPTGAPAGGGPSAPTRRALVRPSRAGR